MACRTLELFGPDTRRTPVRCASPKRLDLDWDESLPIDAEERGNRSRATAKPRVLVAKRSVAGSAASRSVARCAEQIVFRATTALALAGAVVGGMHLFAASPAQSSAKPIAVIIAPGENLWSVAQRYAAPGQSTADTVSEIRAANPNLSQGQTLSVGERILVPAAR